MFSVVCGDVQSWMGCCAASSRSTAGSSGAISAGDWEATFQDAETSSLVLTLREASPLMRKEPSESGFGPSLIVQEETVLVAQIEFKWFLLVIGKL
jgi:hypothetical protein